MKILVTGGSGQLGKSLQKKLEIAQKEFIAPPHKKIDICDELQLENFFEQIRPDVVIHCAAYSNVELAERDRQRCFRTNVYGTNIIAKLCQKWKSYLVYISTDYVFDGKKDGFYQVDDLKNPLSVYGKTKSEGEDLVIKTLENSAVIRTSWLFGPSENNFVKSILRNSIDKNSINVVADQVGSPTYTDDLANLLIEVTNKRPQGILHATNEGTCSWAEFAEKILDFTGRKVQVNKIFSFQYSSRAMRPKNSRLSKESLDQVGLSRLPYWENSLFQYLNL